MKLSIITVVKNDKKNIPNTIDSLLKQKFKNYEYIIVDGKSTDGTTEIIKKKIKNKKKIKLIVKKDRNLYEAINRGIKASKGKFIGIIHSGDTYSNNKILNTINKYLLESTDIVIGKLIYINNKRKIVRNWDYKIKKINIFNSFKIAHPTLFIKKKLIKKIGYYNINYKISSDADFMIRLSKVDKLRFKYIDKNFVFMKIGGLSSSFNGLSIKILEDLKIYYKHFGLFFIFLYSYKLIYKLYLYLISLIFLKNSSAR